MATRTAMRFSVNGALEYVELAPGYAIFELDVPDHWAGHTILDLDIRKKFNVNVIGRKESGAILPIDTSFVFVEPDPFSGARGAAAVAIFHDLQSAAE